MRLRNSKRASLHKSSMIGILNGEKGNDDTIYSESFGDVSGNTSKDPVGFSCSEKDELGKAKQGPVEEDQIILVVDGCVGEAAPTKAKREIGHAWKSMSQPMRGSYMCQEDVVYGERCSRNGDGVCRTLSTRCCPGRVGSLTPTMTHEQRSVVKELGFGSIIAVGDINIKRDLCLKLLDHLDLNRLEINYEGVKVTLSSAELGRVMGLSDEGFDVPLYGSEESIKEIKEKLCSYVRGIPVNELVVKIKSSDQVDNDCKVMFTLLIMYTILTPGSGAVIPHRYLHGAVDVGHICKRNWSKWSFEFLVAGIRKFKRNSVQQYVCGNLLFVQIHDTQARMRTS